jgi:hypothetical protein
MLKTIRASTIVMGFISLAGVALGQVSEPRTRRIAPPQDLSIPQTQPQIPQTQPQFLNPASRGPFELYEMFERIESAIRSLKVEADKKENEEKESREKSDLIAQQEMSRWAFWTMVATWGTTLLSLAALLTIYRTLVHTRRAADASNRMVIEAQQTTVAAREANEIARMSDRPFVMVKSVGHNMREWTSGQAAFEWSFALTNHGKGPAIVKSLHAQTVLSDVVPSLDNIHRTDLPDPYEARVFRENVSLRDEKIEYGFIIEGGALSAPIVRDGMHLLKMNDVPDYLKKERSKIRMLINGPNVLNYYLITKVEYEDTFGNQFSTSACLRLEARSGEITEQGGRNLNLRT